MLLTYKTAMLCIAREAEEVDDTWKTLGIMPWLHHCPKECDSTSGGDALLHRAVLTWLIPEMAAINTDNWHRQLILTMRKMIPPASFLKLSGNYHDPYFA